MEWVTGRLPSFKTLDTDRADSVDDDCELDENFWLELKMVTKKEKKKRVSECNDIMSTISELRIKKKKN